MSNLTRRTFLTTAAAVMPLAAVPGNKIRFGGPIFLKTEDPREMAREHRRLGYSAAYGPAGVDLDAAWLKEYQQAFAAENVTIAEIGAWKNMLDPDPAARRENFQYVVKRMELAEAVGARCCVDIAGSYHPKVWYGPHPKNFSRDFLDATVENCRKVIDAVKPKRTKFAIEMMGWAIPSDPDEYLRLVKAVDRKGFGVHIDVCNGINSPQRFYNSGAFIRECFQKLGQWVVSCHAKDLAWDIEMNVHFREVIPCTGEVDYKAYLMSLAKLPQDAPLMMEHLKGAEQYDQGRQYIQKVAAEVSVSFM